MKDKTFTTFFIIWLAWVLVCLAGAVGIIYAVCHFIGKFW